MLARPTAKPDRPLPIATIRRFLDGAASHPVALLIESPAGIHLHRWPARPVRMPGEGTIWPTRAVIRREAGPSGSGITRRSPGTGRWLAMVSW
jgi:hypothetical protein